jgi:hypothetical protein
MCGKNPEAPWPGEKVLSRFSQKPFVKNKAVIVETRMIEDLVTIIRERHLKYLPTTYGLHIFVAPRNLRLVQNIDFGRELAVTVLPHDITSLRDYNVLMTSDAFWSELSCEKALVFQTDSGLLKEGIEEFEEYDWVGAPWPDNGWSKGPPWVNGSNGGLSLRSVKAMRRCIARYEWNPAHNEDGFFCLGLTAMSAKISREANSRFAVESIFRLGTLGYHAVEKWLPEHQVRAIKRQYTC